MYRHDSNAKAKTPTALGAAADVPPMSGGTFTFSLVRGNLDSQLAK